MDERDASAGGTPAGRIVDEPIPGGAAPCESPLEIRHAVADVVNPRTAAGEKFGDGAIRVEWFEELHLDVTERQGDDCGAVRRLRGARREPKNVTVEGQGGRNARHRDADVSNPGWWIRHTVAT